jgi:hypothetical protein
VGMESVERNYDFKNLMSMEQKFCAFLGKFTHETWVLLNQHAGNFFP